MTDPRKSTFGKAALESGLIDEAALQSCWEDLPPEKRGGDAIDRRLARRAIERQLLTKWQAQQLLQGRHAGYHIDKYVLLDRIGQGGMGQVFLARDTKLQRPVAIKLLSPERMKNSRARARFAREARIGAQLQHENLVRIYDIGETPQFCYLVMEYIDGTNVGQRIIENGPLPSQEAARIGFDIALGLEHARQKGLIHRDVHPWNILLTRDGVAKLTDLGLAFDKGEVEETPVTREGATVGNFDYIAPEQARDSRAADTRSDLYSLGCSLYHMITGHVPHETPNLPEKLMAHQIAEPVPIRDFKPEAPTGLADVIKRMMSKEPNERYQTPLEAAQALEGYMRTPVEGEPPAQAALLSPAPSPPSVVASAEPSTDFPFRLELEAETDSDSDSDSGSSEGALPLDLGLAPLSVSSLEGTDDERNARPKTSLDPERERRRFRTRLIAISVVAFLAIWCVPLLLIFRGGPRQPTGLRPPSPSPSPAARKAETKKPFAATDEAPRLTVEQAPSGIAVVYPDGQIEPEATLQDALSRISRGSGKVVLVNSAPIKVEKPLIVTASSAVIQAARGASPVIQAVAQGDTPWLAMRSLGRLSIEGVRIEASYTGSSPRPRPLLEAAGGVALERCVFTLGEVVPQSRLLSVGSAGRVQIDDCEIQGFDLPLGIEAQSGTQVNLKNVKVRAAGPNRQAIEIAPRGAATRRLRPLARLESCTVDAAVFLWAGGFTSSEPLAVELKSTRVEADAVLLWGSAADQFPKGIAWKQQDATYSIRGPAWVLLEGEGGANPNPLPDGPTDEASWNARLAGSTTGSTGS